MAFLKFPDNLVVFTTGWKAFKQPGELTGNLEGLQTIQKMYRESGKIQNVPECVQTEKEWLKNTQKYCRFLDSFQNIWKVPDNLEIVWKKNSTFFLLGVFVRNVHLGFGYFLLLNPVATAQRSWTKSESRCYHVVITTDDNSQRFSPIYDNIYLEDFFFI